MDKLIKKRFKVWVGGEVERTCNFLGLLQLLKNYSDFFEYTQTEMRFEIQKWVKERRVYVDANITATF